MLSIALILIISFCFFCSCQKESRSCEELLLSSLEYGIDGYGNSGVLFLKNVDKDSVFFMSDARIIGAYGKRFKASIDSCEDFAIYFSASDPYEIAIFKCYSKNDAEDILRMCYERSDEKKIGLRFTEWEEQSKFIEIGEYKSFVFFVFTDSQSRNEAICEQIISSVK